MFNDLRISARARLAWLALTPEPERELPILVAALRCAVLAETADANSFGPAADNKQAAFTAAEAKHVDHLVLHGTARSWQRYLHEITALIQTAGPFVPPGTTLAAAEVVLDHHRMLIGLPGTGYRRTAADRAALTELVDTLNDRKEGQDRQ